MHTFSETGAGVPAFLAKLWRLVDDPETNNLICWSKDGRSFIIQNQAQFARELLPLNYKHNNMASFIRQLNMYGFHKITSIDNGGLKFDRDEMEFSHPCFKRNCPYLLEHIKRKIANTKTLEDKAGIKPEAVSKVLQDVKAMRGRQDSLDSRFSVMKQENEALWREIASLRQKHAKQQQIVNKLIQFLITIVQPSRNMTGVKRHMQLMINDTPENAKLRKTSETESDCGPVIHELGEELLDEVADAETDLIDHNSPYVKMECPGQGRENDESPSPLHEERPHSSISQISQHYDYSNQSAEDALMLANPAVAASISGSNGNNKLTNSPPVAGGGASSDSSIIQSVNPDGSHIFYHVTEVPDGPEGGNGHENVPSASPNYNEENVLTTPMVRVQMARTEQLKQKNKQRRKQSSAAAAAIATSSGADVAGALTAKMPRLLQHHPNVQSPTAAPSPPPMGGGANSQRIAAMKIKAEKVMDPMAFLNVYPDERVLTPDPALISPTMSEDSRPASANLGLLSSSNADAVVTPVPQSSDDRSLLGNSSDFYNPNDFISGDMPADIFEDSSLMSNEGNSYNNQQEQQQQQQQQQQQRLLRSAASGKFSAYATGNGSSGASTSAAAAAAAAAGASNNQFTGAPASSNNNASNNNKSTGNSSVVAAAASSSSQGKNGNNMTLAKYNKNGFGHEDILRLSTLDEVSGHLDNVQDELETLKDLLRSDSYSLDANTLLGNGAIFANVYNNQNGMSNNNRNCLPPPLDGDLFNKLFNDPDIMDPYGLALPNDNSSDKKGLTSYQPVYDLSDIININSNNELEVNEGASSPLTPNSARPLQALESGSTLNTPYHE